MLDVDGGEDFVTRFKDFLHLLKKIKMKEISANSILKSTRTTQTPVQTQEFQLTLTLTNNILSVLGSLEAFRISELHVLPQLLIYQDPISLTGTVSL